MSSGVYLTNFSQLAHCLAEFVELACVVAFLQPVNNSKVENHLLNITP